MADTADQIDVLLRTVCQVSLDRREEFDRMDDVAGDGDFGTTLARGTAALAADPPGGEPADRLRAASELVTEAMGGSSGPLCGVALLRASDSITDGRASRPRWSARPSTASRTWAAPSRATRPRWTR